MARHHGQGEPSYNSKSFLGVFRYSGQAIRLVWETSPKLTVALILLSLVAGLLPAAIAYIGKWLVDAVVLSAQTGDASHRADAIRYVLMEAGLVVLLAAMQRGLSVCQALLRALLGNRVNVMILDKALSLDLTLFEDSEFYDKMTRARRQASSRPLSLVMRTFGLIQNAISLVTYGALLISFSPIAVAILAFAALPTFFAETKFSGEAFRLFRWRTPEAREQMYLETVIAREDYAKEVKLFGLGRTLLARYQSIFHKLYEEDRSLTMRRGFWGYLLGLLSTAAFYGSYAWIVLAAIEVKISIGEMTMFVMVFKQGQSAMAAVLSAIGGMYEDNLYLSNLYEYLEQEVPSSQGVATAGLIPGDGLRFENVSFAYPGSDTNAVEHISFHLTPGTKLALVGQNGSGKTTIIKLLTRLYSPSEGKITLDGLDLGEWDDKALRDRLGVIFQDFVRYQFKVGENIGVGDHAAFANEEAWRVAAEEGMAAPFIEELPDQYQTQLGRWFKGGRELSLGQWQKIALSRAFIRKTADIVVLDEPTASMDAAAEAQIFEHFREITQNQMAIVISHRFSTVRMADEIIVLDRGRIIEHGSHEGLIEAAGDYARLFEIQAKGYL
ncbi:MAG: ABC transporter ATP-binding protein [Myxococcales bacterium]|nr:ABC transporter ATP-binding protein [Myxococcales bacterium]